MAKHAHCCRNCQYFRNDPAYLEVAFKGLSSLSSAYASVRCEDGICTERDIYLSPSASCDHFSPAP